ncbi:hypothetical protein TEA_019565 [Camellia sinensis var. sinensis]|uniref:NB-ARC domain-containing protein n=1 Tax=Camellia sinensis var. sinensis TaxID=542762 RepID=A0A4S4F0L3_CAMSN|nr:hypothetical protein TEA_019565 [Camellia sinensis var. sinensis]
MELLRKLIGQDEKMQTLRNNLEALDSRAADVKAEVEDAELQTRKKQKHEVENWLRNVERMKNGFQNLEQEVRERKISLLLLGNRVDKLNAEIAQLHEQGSFQGGLLLDVIGKLQSDIAKCLKLDLSNENDEKKRAAELSQAFASRGKCVLFLDDVWHKIDLHRVGIPNGCKLILTTRLFDVCRKMGCKEFKVEPLSEEAAWNLFWAKLCNGEERTLSPEVIDIARFVAAECDGLHLGLLPWLEA